MNRDEIPPGTLYLLILKTVALHGELHCYEIADSIQPDSEDVLQVEEGSLYPALQRMLIKGWGLAKSGNARRQPAGALLSPDRARPQAVVRGSVAVRRRYGSNHSGHLNRLRKTLR